MSRLHAKQWLMTHLFKIRTKVRGYAGKLVTFTPNRFQREKYNLLYGGYHHSDGRHYTIDKIIELKPRKHGTTTGWAIDTLCEVAYMRRYWHAITMAHSQEKVQSIFLDIIKPAWEAIPEDVRPKTTYSTKAVIDLMQSRGSKYAITNDAKGLTPNRLHITETAYFDSDEDIIESINSLADGGQCIAESTAYGEGNWFEQTFTSSWARLQSGKVPEFFPLFYPWYSDPNNVADIPSDGFALLFEREAREIQARYRLTDAQILWWDKKKQTNGDLVYQFYPSYPEEAFLRSGRSVFDLVQLAMLSQRHSRSPSRIQDEIEIWEEPRSDYMYGIGVDTAEGVADGDYSVISVVCKNTGEEVAQYAARVPPHMLADKVEDMCRLYRNHLAVVERNNHGHVVINELKDKPHVNLYRRVTKDRITDREDMVLGWDTNQKSKTYAISTLNRELSSGSVIPHCPMTYAELRSYIYAERGKMEAQKGKHDDRVIALALAVHGTREMITNDMTFLSDIGFY